MSVARHCCIMATAPTSRTCTRPKGKHLGRVRLLSPSWRTCQLFQFNCEPQRHRPAPVIAAKNCWTVEVGLEILLHASVGAAIHQSARVVDALCHALPGQVYGGPIRGIEPAPAHSTRHGV